MIFSKLAFDFSIFFALVITPGLTVAICGLFLGQIIVAIIFPPKAGLVIRSFLSSASTSSPVQSAVSPVPSLAASLGPISLPIEVAPTKRTSGFLFFTSFESTSTNPKVEKSFNSLCST